MLKCRLEASRILQQIIKQDMCSINPNQQLQAKSYRMPVKKEIELYRPQFPLRLHNYKVLLYANQQHLYTPTLLQTHIVAPFIVIISLIRSNPWYLTFPASLPIMLGLEFLLFFRWIFHKKHYKFIIQRVYLHTENFIEFVFANKIRRKLKNTEATHLFHDPIELITPSQGDNGDRVWNQRGFPFPTELKYKKNPVTNEIECFPPMTPLFYGWVKHCGNYQAYVFPKKYEYANWQILVPLFNGRYINFDDCTNEIHELPEGQHLPSIDQQLEWIKQDNALNEQVRRKRIEDTARAQ